MQKAIDAAMNNCKQGEKPVIFKILWKDVTENPKHFTMDDGQFTPYKFDKEVLLADGESLEISKIVE